MAANNDPIYDRMGLAPLKTVELVPVDRNKGEQIEDDLDEVRSNIQDLHEVGLTALEEIRQLATASQDPKAYRELSVLLKVLIEANKTQVDVAATRNEVIKKNESVVPPVDGQVTNTQNNIFLGSTKEALAFMRQQRLDGNKESEE